MVQEAIGTLTEVISHYVNHSVDLVKDCQRTLQKSIKSLSLLQKLYVVAHFTCPGQRTHDRLMGISTKLLECTTAIPKPQLDAVSNGILMEEAVCSALILDHGFMFPFSGNNTLPQPTGDMKTILKMVEGYRVKEEIEKGYLNKRSRERAKLQQSHIVSHAVMAVNTVLAVECLIGKKGEDGAYYYQY